MLGAETIRKASTNTTASFKKRDRSLNNRSHDCIWHTHVEAHTETHTDMQTHGNTKHGDSLATTQFPNEKTTHDTSAKMSHVHGKRNYDHQSAPSNVPEFTCQKSHNVARSATPTRAHNVAFALCGATDGAPSFREHSNSKPVPKQTDREKQTHMETHTKTDTHTRTNQHNTETPMETPTQADTRYTRKHTRKLNFCMLPR